jgi:hypothetical protein
LIQKSIPRQNVPNEHNRELVLAYLALCLTISLQYHYACAVDTNLHSDLTTERLEEKQGRGINVEKQMLPPPGFEPADASPTSIFAAIATSIALGVDVPTLTAVATATATSFSFVDSHHDQPTHSNNPNVAENGECRLLGPFAILVQGALGCLALLALVYKRWRERPQRPLKIWSFDVSKQVVGSVLVHIANLLMSMLSSGQFNLRVEPATVAAQRSLAARMVDDDGHYRPNPCSFYLLNLAIDVSARTQMLKISTNIDRPQSVSQSSSFSFESLPPSLP